MNFKNEINVYLCCFTFHRVKPASKYLVYKKDTIVPVRGNYSTFLRLIFNMDSSMRE